MSEGDPEPGSRPGALAGLLVVALLVLALWLVMGRLRESGRMQDCVAAGRSNCAPIGPPAPRP